MPVEQRVIAVMTKELGQLHMSRSVGEISTETELAADLTVNLLDRLCICVALDEEFGIEIRDSAMDCWDTVGDVVTTVEALAECMEPA
jgi:acyl carrier protein